MNMELREMIEKIQNEGIDLKTKDLAQAIKMAKETNSAELAYLIADIEETQRERMEKIVLKAKDPRFCALYVTDIPGADVEKHKKIIFNSKNVEAICYYLSRVNASSQDIEKAFKIVVEKNDPRCAFELADSVRGVNMETLERIVRKSKDEEYIKKFMAGLEQWNDPDISDAQRKKLCGLLGMALGKQHKAMLRKERPQMEEMEK